MGASRHFRSTSGLARNKYSKIVRSILAMVTVAAGLQPDSILTLRNLIMKDISALRNWSAIVDKIVNEPADVLRVKALLDKEKYAEAVLQSLQVWYSYGQEREDLLAVFRDEGLQTLASTSESECSAVLGEMKPAHKTGDGFWFEVAQVLGSFTGRESQLEAMHKKLTESHSQESADKNVVLLSGLGGVGKSTLARKYAYTHRRFYGGNVLWINAETIDSMRASFIRLAKALGLQLGDQPPIALLVERVFAHFQNKKCLLIFDNVEKLEDLKQFLPEIRHPDHEMPYVLVTSRRTDLNALPANEIRLDVLTPEEAVELIQKQLPKAKSASAVKLADKLQRLPLALQQAVAYIRHTYVDNDDQAIFEYLKEFEKSEAKLLNDERFRDHNDYTSTTFATWQITLIRIGEMNGDGFAIRVMRALAYLNPELISVKFVRTIFEEEVGPGLKLLERFSMISVSDGKVGIHRLVQHVVRLSFGERAEDEVQTLVTAIGVQFEKDGYKPNDINRECSSHGLHLFPFQMTQRHSAAMATNCLYFVDLCTYLLKYGNYAEALSISQQIASLYESAHGKKHESTIGMKWIMAVAHSRLGKFPDSLPILNSILPTAKDTLGTEHWFTLHIQSRLAIDLGQTGNNEEAVRIYDEILPVAGRVYGENDNTVLVYKTNKADALRELGKLDEALELLQHVHETRVSLLGENDVSTLDAKSKIAHAHYDKKEFSRALQMWEEVEARWSHTLGDAHPEIVKARNNIAIIKAQLAKRERQNCKML